MKFNSTFRETKAKNEIREKVFQDFRKLYRRGQVHVVSMLPGRTWEVEKRMMRLVNHSGREILMECYERNSIFDMLEFAPRMLPRWVQKNYGTQYEYCQGFNWADYCGTPTTEIVRKFMEAVTTNNVIYLTFMLTPRGRHGVESIDRNCRKAMTHPVKSERARVLLGIFERKIKRKRGRNFTRILFKSYRSPKHTMVTMGWHFTRRSPIKTVKA